MRESSPGTISRGAPSKLRLGGGAALVSQDLSAQAQSRERRGVAIVWLLLLSDYRHRVPSWRAHTTCRIAGARWERYQTGWGRGARRTAPLAVTIAGAKHQPKEYQKRKRPTMFP
jgi:hypothetical protein